MKVLHTGDLHLGMKHTSRNYPEALRQMLQEARFAVLEKLVETANRENCQLFVVAGDLFHTQTVGKEAVLQAAGILGRFEGNCVAVLPGNHDYYSEGSQLWKVFTENCPEQVLLLKNTEAYCLQDYDLDAVLYPAPCDRKHSAENRVSWIKELAGRPEATWHFGVAHGTVLGISPDLDGRYFPMERGELLNAGLDHWFLGHTHVCHPEAEPAENCGFAYCGTPEPDGFDCGHQGYAWLREFTAGGSVSRLLRTGIYHFRDVACEIKSLEELTPFMAQAGGETVLMKLAVSGVVPRDEYKVRGAFFRELAEKVACLELDDGALGMAVTENVISEEFPAGSFPELFLSALAGRGNPEALQLAYELVKKVKK
jgi:DNA repair exonuclease SbcCD nuclease subunit